MSQNKTIPTGQAVTEFLDAIEDERKREDSYSLLELMKEITGLPPKMWGSSIIGFGSYHYKYESGREGDMMLAGYSPRKQALTIYNIGSLEQYPEQAANLGKYTTGKGCLYIKALKDVDLPTLKQLLEASFERKSKAEH